MLSISDLQLKYGNKIVLDNLSFASEAGEIIGILGKNGVGKTTLLKAIVGLKEVSKGDICSKPDISIGFVPEVADVYEYLTGMDFLMVLSDLKGFSKNDLLKLLSWIGVFIDLPDLKVGLSKLSKGSLEKIMFVQSLISYPQILVLDEPFSGFDTKSMIGSKRLLKEYADKGNIIILSTHIIELCSQLCDKVVFLHNSELNEIITFDDNMLLDSKVLYLENKINSIIN